MAGLTREDLEGMIKDVAYHVFPGTRMTVCCIQLKHDFHVIGENACTVNAVWDEELGREYAYVNAFNKLWALEGYHSAKLAHGAPALEGGL